MRPSLFYGLFLAGNLIGQERLTFTTRSIPDKLLAEAHAVVRLEETRVEVKSPAEMNMQYHRIITILDQKGLEHALLVLPYDKFQSLREVNASVYDAAGAPLKSYKKKDFEDLAYLDDLTMASSARYLYLDLKNWKPPFTLEVNYTSRFKGTLKYPDFSPQSDYGVSVEKARFELTLPTEQRLHFKACQCSVEPDIAEIEKNKTYTWSFENLPAIPDESYNLPISQLAPRIRLAPGQFDMAGYTGSFESWDGLAGWNQQMLNALPPLDPKTVEEIRALTNGLPERERIRTVYRLMQNSTRYISIQLGIGGWQPFDPNLVHTKKYGDCKALSWYTRALLEAAGVKAYYTLVYAGDNPAELDPDFPDNTFNHVILTVPTASGDTLWLECTSQVCPLGYMGAFTGNRKALAIDQDKGHVIHIPALPADVNVHSDSVQIQLDADGKTAQIHWHSGFSGMAIEDDHFFAAVYHADPQDRKKWIENNFPIKGGRVESFAIQMDTAFATIPRGQVDIRASSAQLFQVTAKRLYIQPNFFQPWETVLSAGSARISPVFRRFGHTWVADMAMALPEGWGAESLPASVTESTPWGTFSRIISFTGGTLHYRRSITLQAGTFPAATYNELVVFFKKMKKWDGESAVFVKKD